MSTPRDHHYAPQFYLRNFAVDEARRKISTVAKNGHRAVWSVRSIEGLGYERDFYVHTNAGVPVSVETAINRRLETPIAASDAWLKVTSGRADALDHTDKATLYALIRHLHARTPHTLETMKQLTQMAARRDSEVAFSEEERAMYAQIRETPGTLKAQLNFMSSSLEWTSEDFEGCWMSVMRSPIPLRSSTTPVLTVKAPDHPALKLPLPGMTPYAYALPLDPATIVVLAIGDFDGSFSNIEIPADVALGFNRQYVGQFAFFDTIRHLITGREGLAAEMTWAPYDYLEEDDRRMVFRRRPTAVA